jgi:hypothetical protein
MAVKYGHAGRGNGGYNGFDHLRSAGFGKIGDTFNKGDRHRFLPWDAPIISHSRKNKNRPWMAGEGRLIGEWLTCRMSKVNQVIGM